MAMLRGDMKQLVGWAPRPTHPAPVVIRARAGGGQKFSFKPLLSNNPTQIFVKVDGVMMMENHDYHIDMIAGEITFNPQVMKIYGREEIEIRSTGPDVDPFKQLILLPRKIGDVEFTDEQLSDLMSDVVGNVFPMSQIERYNPDKVDVIKAGGYTKIQVKQAVITPDGIVGIDQVVIVDG